MPSEAQLEQTTSAQFSEIGYAAHPAVDLGPTSDTPARTSAEQVVLEPRLRAALRRIHPDFPEDALDDAIRTLSRPPEPTLEQNNRWFHNLLLDGIPVDVPGPDGDGTRGEYVMPIDFEQPANNDFLVVSQLTVQGPKSVRRPDLVVYINGLPIAVLELKDPSDEQATVWKAYDQLQDYKRRIPDLLAYNGLLVISDGQETRVGSLTAGRDRFAPWRSIESDQRSKRALLEDVIRGLFEPARLLDYLRHGITFEDDARGKIVKKIAAYHQFRAVRAAREAVAAALQPRGDGRGGVVWHTQGSGKSLTMLMLSGALIADARLANPTIVVVTDRNDLDDQLFDTFAKGRRLLRQDPAQAESRDDLRAKLNRASGGVIFTTIQKFEEAGDAVTPRSNVVVLADEAHRSQYGFLDGGARWMREALPNATFVGFTGTPIDLDDRSTRAVFGDYVDVYDIRQAIDDNATVPIYYEMQLVKLLPDDAGIEEGEAKIRAAAEADYQGVETPLDIEVPLEELAGAPPRLLQVADKIVEHFEARREVIEGKGMVVCMSRAICMDLYDEIVALRPDWHGDDDADGRVKVVMDPNVRRQREGESDQDYDWLAERIRSHGRTKGRRATIADRFKNPDDDLRLVIVCDMWLTGFDCPPLHTLYLDKPLAGHNLMQAIARVNRVFGDKPGGVVVDFLGIADQLRDAVHVYTQAGGEGQPVQEIQDQAVPLMLEKVEALDDFFADFPSVESFVRLDGGAQQERLQAGMDYVFAQSNGKQRFLSMVAALSKAFALSVPREETLEVRERLIFYQAVRAAIRKSGLVDAPAPPPDTRAAVRQVLAGAIATDGVIDLFQAAGIDQANVGILSDDFLDRLAAMPHKNLALETLRKLLNDQIRSRERVNLVQSRGFREALEASLSRYTNRAITTAQVIEELLGLARTIRDQVAAAEASGLSDDERAFYDALADNDSARHVMQDDTLRQIACELAESLKKKATLDWTQRETVRADMRRTVRRLLAKHGYPPDQQETATQLVIRQAELTARALVEA